MSSKDDFMKKLYAALPNEFYDPEAVDECVDNLYDVLDTISYMLNPADLDAIEYAIAQIICWHLPPHNADGIAEQMKDHIRKWGEED